jgi:hypothetical protein
MTAQLFMNILLVGIVSPSNKWPTSGPVVLSSKAGRVRTHPCSAKFCVAADHTLHYTQSLAICLAILMGFVKFKVTQKRLKARGTRYLQFVWHGPSCLGAPNKDWATFSD